MAKSIGGGRSSKKASFALAQNPGRNNLLPFTGAARICSGSGVSIKQEATPREKGDFATTRSMPCR